MDRRLARHRRRLLIVPLWNWNTTASPAWAASLRLLIVPLWNWNSCPSGRSRPPATFNRTIVELKYGKAVGSCTSHTTFNRTIVELKSEFKNFTASDNKAFNRTIVELKFRHDRIASGGLLNLLIVPLWNWNVSGSVRRRLSTLTFNRTIVELKCATCYYYGSGQEFF